MYFRYIARQSLPSGFYTGMHFEYPGVYSTMKQALFLSWTSQYLFCKSKRKPVHILEKYWDPKSQSRLWVIIPKVTIADWFLFLFGTSIIHMLVVQDVTPIDILMNCAKLLELLIHVPPLVMSKCKHWFLLLLKKGRKIYTQNLLQFL